MIRVIIADDQALVRDGLRMIVDLEDDINVLALAENGRDAVEKTRQIIPDLVLMDINMPILNGIDATREIKLSNPDIRILVLTTYDGGTWIQDAIDAGADGYLLKDTPREELIQAIRGTMEGNNYIDPNVAGKVMRCQLQKVTPPDWATALNDLERNVLKYIGQGKSNAQISELMDVSEDTVLNLVSTVLTKLDVNDRTQAVILAVKNNLDS